MSESKPWFLYVVKCEDNTLYAGISPDVERRLAVHNSGRGASYTASRRPIRLVAVWKFANQSSALRAEIAFKRLSRGAKLSFIMQKKSYLEAPFVELD